jgi:hypothetical protein
MTIGTISGAVCVALAMAMATGCGGSNARTDAPQGAAPPPSAAAAVAPSGGTAGAGSSSPAPTDTGSASSPAVAASDGARSASAPSAGAPASDTPPKPARAFANTALEAQSIIQEQIDTRTKVLWKCVETYRARKGDPHKPIVIDVGIDQEGSLLGVTVAQSKPAPTPKKKAPAAPSPQTATQDDADFHDCVMDALRGLAFPRSHAGVITVRQTFKDTAVTP